MCTCLPIRLLRSRRVGSSATSLSRSPQGLRAEVCLQEAQSPIRNPRWTWNRSSAVSPLATFRHHLHLLLRSPNNMRTDLFRFILKSAPLLLVFAAVPVSSGSSDDPAAMLHSSVDE